MRTLRTLGLLGLTICALATAPDAALARTYYVNASSGSDTIKTGQATNPSSPFRTIRKALSVALAGDVIVAQPGLYMESVETRRDGIDGAPITIRSETPGLAVIQPPLGSNGVFIKHSHTVLDGFTVTGGVTGVKLGPSAIENGPMNGITAQNNTVYGNSSNGVACSNCQGTVLQFNTVYQNGQSGISHEGNSSVIHDNVVHGNQLFGIYVKDGINHQVWNNQVYNNVSGDLKILGTLAPPPPPPGGGPPPPGGGGLPGSGPRTFYVDAAIGNDSNTDIQAQSPTMPWKTLRTALITVVAGDTVIVQPGVYPERVESKRDGTATNPITIKAAIQGTATIQPPAGSSGFYISHHYHTIDGFVVTGGSNGLQLGPYDGTPAPVNGMVVLNTRVFGNTLAGIKLVNAIAGSVMHNVVYGNNRDGIIYLGESANIFNNIVYANGLSQIGNYGITIESGSGHQILNNTLYGNNNGGMRLGTSANFPVFSTVLNNIVVGSPVGVKEPAGSNYTGRAVLDFNNVYGNTLNYELSNTGTGVPGPSSISLAPVFLNAANADFRLGRVDTGQSADSPCIDRGSDTADALGLGGRTAFIDKHPDAGRVDLGAHHTILKPTAGVLTITQASITLNPGTDGFSLSANLKPGATSDGLALGVNYAEISLGTTTMSMPITGFTQQGSAWGFTGAGPITSGTFTPQADGSVNVTVQGSGIGISWNDTPVTFQVRIGDDYASNSVLLKGTLSFP